MSGAHWEWGFCWVHNGGLGCGGMLEGHNGNWDVGRQSGKFGCGEMLGAL